MRAYVIRVPARNHAAAVRTRAIRVGEIRHARTSAALRLETSSQVTTRLCTSQRSSRGLPSSVTIAAPDGPVAPLARRDERPVRMQRSQSIVRQKTHPRAPFVVSQSSTRDCSGRKPDMLSLIARSPAIAIKRLAWVPVGSGANQLSQTVKFLAKNHKQAARRRCNSPSPSIGRPVVGSCRVDVSVVLRMLLADVDLTKNVREHVARR